MSKMSEKNCENLSIFSENIDNVQYGSLVFLVDYLKSN